MSTPILPTGTTVNDRYVLQRKLGSDGEVYEAHDRHLDQTVAFKLLRPEDSSPQSWAEARRLEQLRSRFIIPVINADVIVNSDLRYIVTRLLPDGDLESEAAPNGLTTALAARFGIHIATGIVAVHAAGMVHRDIKPANALLEGDIAHVSDFEYCCILDENGEAPRNGSWCTLAPEVAADDGVCTVASDVYSLAATVFYLLSGEYPVDYRLPREEQRRLIAAGDLSPLVDLAPHVPRAVAAVINRGMSVDPSARYASAESFANALATAIGHRRSWRRVDHPGHLFCAESGAGHNRKALGVCAISASGGSASVRAFHLGSGRTVSGAPARTVRKAGIAAALRKLFAILS
ncbi:serine/threonine-protein kinase [Georgenia sp. MJ170]|uniref:serine/threonine-protein kinase n=1 Tax=Georgenia sunbinii TaxID=3117728 RepID=UPI002F263210